jgi:hypothetical protein
MEEKRKYYGKLMGLKWKYEQDLEFFSKQIHKQLEKLLESNNHPEQKTKLTQMLRKTRKVIGVFQDAAGAEGPLESALPRFTVEQLNKVEDCIVELFVPVIRKLREAARKKAASAAAAAGSLSPPLPAPSPASAGGGAGGSMMSAVALTKKEREVLILQMYVHRLA